MPGRQELNYQNTLTGSVKCVIENATLLALAFSSKHLLCLSMPLRGCISLFSCGMYTQATAQLLNNLVQSVITSYIH